jgi:hypothetical protein
VITIPKFRLTVAAIVAIAVIWVVVRYQTGGQTKPPTAEHHGSGMSGATAQHEQVGLELPVALPTDIELPFIPFQDVTDESGIAFTHERGVTAERLFPETMGGGCAVIDINSDGLPDVVFVNSKRWDWDERSDAPAATMSAWLNVGNLQFEDVTQQAGLDISLYGMGTAVGDFDNDHDQDLYVTAVGRNYLLRNDDGTFVDVTSESQTGGDADAWSTSAGWFDYDLDGDLDLFVCNYITWNRDLETVTDAISFGGQTRFGAPAAYPGDSPYLFRNEGDGEFVEVAEISGLQQQPGKSLGVAFADFDGDRYPDIFVANDGIADQLFHNQGDRTFAETGTAVGVAFSSTGAPRAGMGVDVSWFRNNGSPGIAVGNYENELTGLYVAQPISQPQSPSHAPAASQGLPGFVDESSATGLGQDSRLDLTWGVYWSDLDLDGRQDLLTINGHVEEDDHFMAVAGRYLQPPKIYWNSGRLQSHELIPLTVEQCGEGFCEPTSGRSAALADFDNDGDQDIIIASSGKAARVLRNDVRHDDAHWIRIRLIGTTASRSAMGATIQLTASGVTQKRQVSVARGYLSSAEPTVFFGLGASTEVDSVVVEWPGGQRQNVDVAGIDREYIVVERH